ncbi:hydroxymethylpyrimidine/phosphomethylpyrimidine kinase [Pseudobutyrivibrio sp. NOR37]|uniref:Hydroxymethylpyrimidine/phosphomethylpyrimidine kinase n=1 Tax=Pseudobutyrivibrio xylanivorans TaxID=185007 RepID=A0A6M0LDJ3_PSEXY|nr:MULTISPECIES: bifunctional hydroxymethylpyrimidine kinase/phosphomethylpyrimidine kinase [Pseudobutyrivibrio]NEX00634.1 bifunctional hydroxymethylpyrimidine kinase/phosphomethylpyrimidine kinase [Pseudobutyrivibrio xylanivorans]SFR61662.1 hydroxymethylpyrimidine/phosphomethylpyrimidine kinase [Pseudobutyrivibrio sp. NOR37]
MKAVLSIAGSDSSGGAGIQADLKTMTVHGVFGMTAITALTAQNTTGVTAIQESTPEFLEKQIDACLSDIPVDAVKIGMLPSAEQVEVVAKKLKEYKVRNLVVDPVMVATSGSKLMKDSTASVMANLLFPISTVITPNIPEAEALLGKTIANKNQMEEAAKALSEEYGCSVLIKGGHSIEDACDVLFDKGQVSWYETTKIDNPNTHGTGCTLSSAIASNLALGFDLKESVKNAKEYITSTISDGLDLGKGSGPLNHMVGLIREKGDADGSNKRERLCSGR